MTEAEELAPLQVPAREIPVPSTISSEAQAYLAQGAFPTPENPPLDDPEAWRTMIAAIDEALLRRIDATGLTADEGYDVEEVSLGQARAYAVTPSELSVNDQRVYLEPHGGGFIVGGGELCRPIGVMTAAKYGMRVWELDYRMPPDHPYPAAVDDCLSAYRLLLKDHDAKNIVVGGVSAGGNLAAALILRARDEGLPIPSAAVLLTPGMDLSSSGDTAQTNRGVDTVLGGSDGASLALYAGGHDLSDPYLSPVFGDFSRGFPPTILASGTRDILLSDTVRTHRALRAAGIYAELHVLEAAPHGFFAGLAPEDRALDAEVKRFIDDHCPAP